MAWECVSCHRSIPHDHDIYDHGKKPICWDCLYEQRTALLEALLEACEAFLACEHNPQTNEAKRDELVALLTMREIVIAIRGKQ